MTAEYVHPLLLTELSHVDTGQGPFDDPRFFREAYRRFRFGLKRSAYMDLVEGISRDNAALDKLTNQCSALEPARRSRTRIPNFERIRGNACSVFDTLQKGVPGTCKESHVVSLYMNAVENESELESNELLDGSDELTFRIVLYHESIAPSAITLPWDFGEAEVRFLDSMTASSGSRDTAETQSKPTRVKRAIRFQDPDPAPCAQQDLATQYQQQQQQQAVEEIRDLCASIEQLRAVQCGVCLGYLRDVASPRRHGLFWPKKPLMDRGPLKKVSLRAVLAARDTQHGTKLSLGDGRRLALSLALGVLRLHDTPWLGRRWGCDDVTLIHQDGKLLAKYPIVSTHLGQAPMPKLACPAKQAYFAPSRNDSLFALGVVLIELCMREPFDQLSAPEDLTQDSTKHAASDFLTATRLLDEVYDRAGGRYGDAVRRCILCEFDQRKTSLEDDAFRRAVYDNVVTVLQEAVNQFYNL